MARKNKIHRKSGKSEQNALINAIDKTRLLEEYLPAVQEFVHNGGTVEGFLRKSTPVAYQRLAELMMEDDPNVAHKAVVEMLNRAEGKPIERKQVLYQDIGEMNEKQLDAEIIKALKKDPSIAGALADEKVISQPKLSPKQRPKFIDLDADDGSE